MISICTYNFRGNGNNLSGV
uniref:Uncharacterized protein n=1 Tax=Anguilla anguilla TaxID=7936 RepID=A0A0E9T9F1_ANGAN